MQNSFQKIACALAFAGIFMLPLFAQAEGRNVFETEQINSESPFWGRSGIFDVKKIAVNYKSQFAHSICEIGHKVRKYRDPSDNFIVSIYKGDAVDNGELIEEIIVPAADLAENTNSYNFFPLNECIIASPGEEYNFIFSRSQLSSGNGYISALQYGGNPNVAGLTEEARYFQFFKGKWHEDTSKDWSLQLKGYREPIIIIPGILGTRINNSETGEEIWPGSILSSIKDDFLNKLILEDNGTYEKINSGPGKILDDILEFNAYEELLETFEKYEEGQDLLSFGYDWRKDILDTAEILKKKIADLAANSVTGKVNLIAHSMGSVMIKEYLNQHGEGYINNFISIGAPYLGSPKGFKAINYGDNLGIAILNEERVKIISQNMPAVYQLLPSEKYVDINGGYIQDFRNGNSNILSFNETSDLMKEQGRNAALVTRAAQFHEALDNYDIELENWTNIVSCNQTKTIGKIYLYDKGKIDIGFTNGDGTVPLASAIYNSSNADNYFVLENEIGTDHRRLVVDDEPLSLIQSIIEGKDIELPEGVSQVIADCSEQPKFKVVSTHSPVIPHFYDIEGNHTGPDNNGDIELGIPGSEYFVLGENHFGIMPSDIEFRVEIESTDTGEFDLKIKKLDNGEVLSLSTFLSIPIDNKSQIATYFSDGAALSLDRDGDGEEDLRISPTSQLSEVEANDIQSPTINIEGVEETEYEIGKVLSIFVTIQDNLSGPDIHQVTLNNIALEDNNVLTEELGLGDHILLVEAYDKAGNLAVKEANFSVIEELQIEVEEDGITTGSIASGGSSSSGSSDGQVLGTSTINEEDIKRELLFQIIELLKQLIVLLQNHT